MSVIYAACFCQFMFQTSRLGSFPFVNVSYIPEYYTMGVSNVNIIETCLARYIESMHFKKVELCFSMLSAFLSWQPVMSMHYSGIGIHLLALTVSASTSSKHYDFTVQIM